MLLWTKKRRLGLLEDLKVDGLCCREFLEALYKRLRKHDGYSEAEKASCNCASGSCRIRSRS